MEDTVEKPTGRRRAGDLAHAAATFFRDRYLSADPRWLGIFRIGYGTLLCVDLIRRWAVAREFYTNDGLLPSHYSIFAPMGRNVFSIYHAFSTYEEVSVAFGLTLVAFLLFTIGYRTRLFHFISAVCITSLNARNLFVENGGTIVVNLLAIYTLFLPLGRRFSVDAVLASLRARREVDAAELNDRKDPPPDERRAVSLAVLALILQWCAIYFFNAVHKSGAGWRDGTALHWFWHQDRIVTALGIWAREHSPLWATRSLTYGTLAVEGILAGILLMPFFQTWTRRLALLLAVGLHGGIALSSRLGPFSYAMTLMFVLLLGEQDFRLLARWFGRPGRARTVLYDGDCGICFALCRVLKRLDPFERLLFVDNRDPGPLPDGLSPALLDSTIVVLSPDGRVATEERAVYEIVKALPLGVAAVLWLRVPGLSWVGRRLYRAVADRRARISAWLGLGVCGLDEARPAEGSLPEPHTPPFREELRHGLAVLREGAVLLLMVIVASQILVDNRWAAKRVKIDRPPWFAKVIDYPRLYQGWRMFAPEPPYEDGRVVVDGRTVDGRKLDPLTGKEPEFDPYTDTGWGHSQLWCDWHHKIRLKGHTHNRRHLKDWLLNQHRYSGRPHDRLVAFDIWWVQDKSPPPGELRGKPLPPLKLLSHGTVTDSGAAPWRGQVAR